MTRKDTALCSGRKEQAWKIFKEENKAHNFPGGSDGKEAAHNLGFLGSVPGSGRYPGVGNGNPLQYSCLRKRSLMGYSPWGCKKPDMTE